jgi:GT2 family glycosyltransferase
VLSVVIPFYAQPGALSSTLTSLARQTAAGDEFEVVVADDASPEPAAPIAECFESLPVRVIRHERNGGRAMARNTGAGAGRGEHLLFLDADSVAHPGLIEAHLKILNAEPDRAVLGRRIEPNWKTARAVTGADAPDLEFSGAQDDPRLGFGLDDAASLQSSPWLFTHSHNLSVPRSAFAAIGGFDEKFRAWGWEDTEFGYRLFLHWKRDGSRFRYAPEAVCFHVPHFAHITKNWAEAGEGLRYLRNKHPHFDVERLGSWPAAQVLTQAAYTDFLLRPDSGPEPGAAFTELQNVLPAASRRLWSGRNADRLAAPVTASLDCTRPATETNKPLMGLTTPWADDSFDDVVHWDEWRALTVSDLSALIVEALRLAPVVYLAGTRDMAPDRPLAQPADLALMLECAHYGVREVPDTRGVWVTEIRRA